MERYQDPNDPLNGAEHQTGKPCIEKCGCPAGARCRLREMETTQREAKEPKWMTPLVVAICAAAFTVAVNAVVALINENLQRGLETQRSEQLRVLAACRTGEFKNLTDFGFA